MKQKTRERTIAIAPCLNEEQAIGNVVRKLKPWVDTVVVVDDGSTDRTAMVARLAGAIVLKHKKNQGAGAAIRTAIHYALRMRYPICVVLGGDDQDDPHEIPRLLKKIEEGYDFVQGSRRLKGGRTVDMPLFRRVTTKAYSLTFSALIGKRITDGTNGFRAFRTNICKDRRINLDQQWLNRYELEPYLFYQAIQLGYRVMEVPVTKRYPDEGYTKMGSLKDYWSISRPLFFLRLGLRR